MSEQVFNFAVSWMRETEIMIAQTRPRKIPCWKCGAVSLATAVMAWEVGAVIVDPETGTCSPRWQTASDGIDEFVQDGKVLGWVSFRAFDRTWGYSLSNDSEFLHACTGLEDGKRKVEEGVEGTCIDCADLFIRHPEDNCDVCGRGDLCPDCTEMHEVNCTGG